MSIRLIHRWKLQCTISKIKQKTKDRPYGLQFEKKVSLICAKKGRRLIAIWFKIRTQIHYQKKCFQANVKCAFYISFPHMIDHRFERPFKYFRPVTNMQKCLAFFLFKFFFWFKLDYCWSSTIFHIWLFKFYGTLVVLIGLIEIPKYDFWINLF